MKHTIYANYGTLGYEKGTAYSAYRLPPYQSPTPYNYIILLNFKMSRKKSRKTKIRY